MINETKNVQRVVIYNKKRTGNSTIRNPSRTRSVICSVYEIKLSFSQSVRKPAASKKVSPFRAQPRNS